MRQVESLSHTRWECKYHIVFIPKYRRKVLFGQIRKELGEVFHRLARQKESLIVVGFIKGKSAIHIARTYLCQQQRTLTACCQFRLFGFHQLSVSRLVSSESSWDGVVPDMRPALRLYFSR